MDSLSFSLKSDHEFYGLKLENDTLKIISAKSFAYYPFGEFDRPNKLKSSLGKLFHLSYIPIFFYCDKSGPLDTLFRFQFKTSVLDFFFTGLSGESPPTMEVAKVIVNDAGIRFVNGIEIGMIKTNLFSKVLSRKMPKEVRAIKTIEVARALDGQRCIFSFIGERLSQIQIYTDSQYCEK
jgi:hypothetical protein